MDVSSTCIELQKFDANLNEDVDKFTAQSALNQERTKEFLMVQLGQKFHATRLNPSLRRPPQCLVFPQLALDFDHIASQSDRATRRWSGLILSELIKTELTCYNSMKSLAYNAIQNRSVFDMRSMTRAMVYCQPT